MPRSPTSCIPSLNRPHPVLSANRAMRQTNAFEDWAHLRSLRGCYVLLTLTGALAVFCSGLAAYLAVNKLIR